jgi:hypothetical protein
MTSLVLNLAERMLNPDLEPVDLSRGLLDEDVK